ncbi:MAG: hypothetical protein BWY06_03518 [Candidatus Latescibacteria bacterium ADurb.Bin168]|nr:MAG: hypothetical protein BWY06_03518 [Candidatus Latescibacteria bacterium ADurb.Bin168]
MSRPVPASGSVDVRQGKGLHHLRQTLHEPPLSPRQSGQVALLASSSRMARNRKGRVAGYLAHVLCDPRVPARTNRHSQRSGGDRCGRPDARLRAPAAGSSLPPGAGEPLPRTDRQRREVPGFVRKGGSARLVPLPRGLCHRPPEGTQDSARSVPAEMGQARTSPGSHPKRRLRSEHDRRL